MILSKTTAPHYTWGAGCDGWRWCDRPDLSVIREAMPPHTTETRHRHAHARQVFHVLSGVLSMECDGVLHHVGPDQALEIAPGLPHQARNDGDEPLEFLVISAPSTRGDRDDLT
ncbi:mannose-6-phosphate isomerase-like protein (cupin superfamily) [Rubricella aquisinus]|uniref:Mannose-6-phosphate isomerase-like protein (Cupin superfamily) n=1 Tax=Rubricella aquisinus TaxID=2028108 RepID=A0A840WZD7_9RHOB|nr:mannose-6-phosphate isomerase-like protein (cupin superfamily) [Rubricella aquisinus]